MTNEEIRMTKEFPNDEARTTTARSLRFNDSTIQGFNDSASTFRISSLRTSFVIRISSFVISLLLALSFFTLARPQAPELPRYTFHEEHSRDGIGKFYMGREIAQ